MVGKAVARTIMSQRSVLSINAQVSTLVYNMQFKKILETFRSTFTANRERLEVT